MIKFILAILTAFLFAATAYAAEIELHKDEYIRNYSNDISVNIDLQDKGMIIKLSWSHIYEWQDGEPKMKQRIDIDGVLRSPDNKIITPSRNNDSTLFILNDGGRRDTNPEVYYTSKFISGLYILDIKHYSGFFQNMEIPIKIEIFTRWFTITETVTIERAYENKNGIIFEIIEKPNGSYTSYTLGIVAQTTDATLPDPHFNNLPCYNHHGPSC